MSYNGAFGQIYVKLTDQNIQEIVDKHELRENGYFFGIDQHCDQPVPLREEGLPTQIFGINISPELFELFLDINKDPQGRACVERIG
ncbi:MAG: hypothetical protein WCJ39_10215 [bacterium]